MRITFDPAKRDRAFHERGLAFEDAALVFEGDRTFEFEDARFAYDEERRVTVGFLAERMVIVVWTPRDDARHVISMRKANAREQGLYRERFGQGGPARGHRG